MQWENLTSKDFAKAVKETGVCIISLGVIEKHGDHLPLGTDLLAGHRIACVAADKEPAVVFPYFYFGQIYEARCFPGTITIKPTLLLELILDVLDEIGRNGFKKIIIVNAHGGNNYLSGFLPQLMLSGEKPYSVYLYKGDPENIGKQIRSVIETEPNHGCEQESSLIMGIYPELAKMEEVPEQPAKPLGRLDHMPNMFTGISWYANYPEHYAGDARKSTVEKGKKILELHAMALADFIAAVKADTAVPELTKEFYERTKKVGWL